MMKARQMKVKEMTLWPKFILRKLEREGGQQLLRMCIYVTPNNLNVQRSVGIFILNISKHLKTIISLSHCSYFCSQSLLQMAITINEWQKDEI